MCGGDGASGRVGRAVAAMGWYLAADGVESGFTGGGAMDGSAGGAAEEDAPRLLASRRASHAPHRSCDERAMSTVGSAPGMCGQRTTFGSRIARVSAARARDSSLEARARDGGVARSPHAS